MLQLLAWLRGPRRWVLKSPQHLEQLLPLLDVFPDATIALTASRSGRGGPIGDRDASRTATACGGTRVDLRSASPTTGSIASSGSLRACHARPRPAAGRAGRRRPLRSRSWPTTSAWSPRSAERAGLAMTDGARAELERFRVENPAVSTGRWSTTCAPISDSTRRRGRTRFGFYAALRRASGCLSSCRSPRFTARTTSGSTRWRSPRPGRDDVLIHGSPLVGSAAATSATSRRAGSAAGRTACRSDTSIAGVVERVGAGVSEARARPARRREPDGRQQQHRERWARAGSPRCCSSGTPHARRPSCRSRRTCRSRGPRSPSRSAVALHAVNRAAAQPSDRVVVLGPGSIGLGVLHWSPSSRASATSSSPTSPLRRELALRFAPASRSTRASARLACRPLPRRTAARQRLRVAGRAERRLPGYRRRGVVDRATVLAVARAEGAPRGRCRAPCAGPRRLPPPAREGADDRVGDRLPRRVSGGDRDRGRGRLHGRRCSSATTSTGRISRGPWPSRATTRSRARSWCDFPPFSIDASRELAGREAVRQAGAPRPALAACDAGRRSPPCRSDRRARRRATSVSELIAVVVPAARRPAALEAREARAQSGRPTPTTA